MEEVIWLDLCVRIGQIIIKSYFISLDISLDIEYVIVFFVLFCSFLYMETVLGIDNKIVSKILFLGACSCGIYICRIEVSC